MTNLTLDLQSVFLTDEQFLQLCHNNRYLNFELNCKGDLIIMSPAGGETSNRNAGIIAQLWFWNQQHQLGITFDSSCGFKLPNGAIRSPDAAWIPLEKWEGLTVQEREKFLPICPDFVIELCSPSDNLNVLEDKMEEYRENGTRLGWLLDPKQRQVMIYRQAQPVEIIEHPQSLSGENILPGFVLEIARIW